MITSGYDEQEMNAAINRARAELPRFLQAFKNHDGQDFAVKVPINDGTETERFWLIDISFDGSEFSGKIGNEPGVVHNVKEGQSWKVRKNDISDWMFIKDGKIYVNYTMRPLLKRMPADQAAKWRSRLAEL